MEVRRVEEVEGRKLVLFLERLECSFQKLITLHDVIIAEGFKDENVDRQLKFSGKKAAKMYDTIEESKVHLPGG